MTAIFSPLIPTRKAAPVNAEPAQVEIVRRSDGKLIVTDIIMLAYNSWLVMLLLGYLHTRYPVLPGVSYDAAVAGLVLLNIVFAAGRPSLRYWSKR
jgi:hypothetical protein